MGNMLGYIVNLDSHKLKDVFIDLYAFTTLHTHKHNACIAHA